MHEHLESVWKLFSFKLCRLESGGGERVVREGEGNNCRRFEKQSDFSRGWLLWCSPYRPRASRGPGLRETTDSSVPHEIGPEVL